MTKPRALHYEIGFYVQSCGKCTEYGCIGHDTDIPIALHFDDVSLYVEGYNQGDFPAGADQDEVRKVQKAIERITNAIDLAAVTGGDVCAEARAEGRGPCGACSWCVKQAQDRAEKAERELAKWQAKKRLVHDVVVRLFKAGVISRDEGAILTQLSLSEFSELVMIYGLPENLTRTPPAGPPVERDCARCGRHLVIEYACNETGERAAVPEQVVCGECLIQEKHNA